jgi:antitoxin VapB
MSSTVHGRIAVVPTLNIKDPEVYELASELARRRHTSMTGAVREALTQAIAQDERQVEDKIRRMTEIAAKASAIDAPWVTDDEIYDERGLPK